MHDEAAEVLAAKASEPQDGAAVEASEAVESGSSAEPVQDGSPVERAEHPGGESFFTGEPGNLSDSEAEELARQQLMRSGLLRGQRVRVGD